MWVNFQLVRYFRLEQTPKYQTLNTPNIECPNIELSEHHILAQNQTSNMLNVTKNWTVRKHWTVHSKTSLVLRENPATFESSFAWTMRGEKEGQYFFAHLMKGEKSWHQQFCIETFHVKYLQNQFHTCMHGKGQWCIQDAIFQKDH